MSLRLGDEAPHFTALTTDGEITFHDWKADSWAVCFSHPANKVRLTLTYPKSTGRNFDEIIRVIDSMQLTDTHSVATPVHWIKGDRVIVSPAMSTEDGRERFENPEEVKPYLRYVDDPS